MNNAVFKMKIIIEIYFQLLSPVKNETYDMYKLLSKIVGD